MFTKLLITGWYIYVHVYVVKMHLKQISSYHLFISFHSTPTDIRFLIYNCFFLYLFMPPAQVDLYTQTHPYGSSSRKEFDPSLGPHDAFLMVDRYIFVQVIEMQN